ncbi:Conserved hypothetical protein [Brachyspira suanatina]|uniref:Uncharacterized protein n=2 Tax=Brachyspira suanatina TaxID=381802 RepID=A0A0G4KB97_9SPIR|nr:hypothetical protein [Brachyspira suanatina]CRF35874.1 Conserved hypothetical protein [Brachyspira suanatina]
MEIVIKDLEEFSKKKAVYAKLGDYNINVNDLSLKIALKLNDYYNSVKALEDVDSEQIINEIVIPIIQRSHPDVSKEKISEDFNYDQLMKIMQMAFESYLRAGSDSKETKESKSDQGVNNKKKKANKNRTNKIVGTSSS